MIAQKMRGNYRFGNPKGREVQVDLAAISSCYILPASFTYCGTSRSATVSVVRRITLSPGETRSKV